MPRKSNHFNVDDRKRADYILKTWKGDCYRPEQYSEEQNFMEGEHPRHEKHYRSKHGRRGLVDDNYEDFSKGERIPIKDIKERHWIEERPEDYETYVYESQTQTYVKPPIDGSGIRRRENRSKQLHPSHSWDSSQKLKYEREFPRHQRSEQRHKEVAHQETNVYPSDEAVLNYAATKIQAAFRGYQARKEYWRKLEQVRREGKFENLNHLRQDDHIIASATSVVDDASVASLAPNADPNLGLVVRLPHLDNSEKHRIIQDLKTKRNYSEGISTTYQLQTETSPNVIILGGINPLLSKDYFLGASLFVYNVQKDKWYYGGTLPEPRNYHTAAYLSRKIYVVGGYSPLEISAQHRMLAAKSTFQMTVSSKRWRQRSDLHEARACHGMCIINDCLMVVGGIDSSGNLLSSVELYYPQRDKWVLMKPLPEAVMGLSCTVLDGCVFVIGGVINYGHSSHYAVSNRAYVFDFERNSWSRSTSLPEPRAYSSVITLKREIWLWGGVKEDLDEDGFLVSSNSIFIYNPEFMKWNQHTAIGTPKHSAAIAKIGRKVFLLGGMSNTLEYKEILNENDNYNRETDKFKEGASLPQPITGAAAVALPIYHASSDDPKWDSGNQNDEVMHEAATKIQSVFRGYKTRSSISNHRFLANSYSRESMKRNSMMDAVVMQAMVEPYDDKWKSFQRVQIEDWPPIKDAHISTSDLNIRLGTLPRGYTVYSSTTGTKVRRYVLLPPHIDPNMSMIGHLCNVQKRNKKIIGLRRVDRLPSFAASLITCSVLQDDSLPVILLMGGLQPRDPVDFSYGKLMLRYHTLKDRFEYFGVLPEPRNFHAAVYYQENIYITGGCDPDKRNSGEMVSTKTTYCLNIHDSEWVEKAEMTCCRAYHSMVVALGKIFVIGGRDNNGRLVASIEAYDVETDKWTLLRPMQHPRMGMACAVVDDHIWVLGGVGLSDETGRLTYPVLSSAVSYDIGKDVWISRPPLRCPRAFASCVVVNDTLWLIGGSSQDRENRGLISMGSVDKYYPVDAQWVRKTLFNYPRHSAAVLAVDTCIYIFGGASSQNWNPVSKNEMIVVDDISLHSCEELPAPLTGVAAVAIPPVMPSLRSESLAMLLHTQLTYH